MVFLCPASVVFFSWPVCCKLFISIIRIYTKVLLFLLKKTWIPLRYLLDVPDCYLGRVCSILKLVLLHSCPGFSHFLFAIQHIMQSCLILVLHIFFFILFACLHFSLLYLLYFWLFAVQLTLYFNQYLFLCYCL